MKGLTAAERRRAALARRVATEIYATVEGRLDEKYMANMVEQANHWGIMRASIPASEKTQAETMVAAK